MSTIQGTNVLTTNDWIETSSSAGKTIRQWEQPESVLGVQPQQVLSYWQSNQLEQIEIIFLEAGNYFGVRESDELLDAAAEIEDRRERKLEQKRIQDLIEKENKARESKRTEFNNLFQKLRNDLPSSLEKSLGVKGRNVTLGKSDWLKTKVFEYSYQEVILRLLMEENQLINLTLLPQQKASKNWSGNSPINSEQQKQKMLNNVKSLPNGDVVIENIPMFDQGDRGYCAIGSLAMVMQYYGLNLNIDALAAKAGYREGDVQNAALEPVYYAAAKEGKLRIKSWPKLDYRDLQKTILKGQPILIWRAFRRERDDFHTDFAQRFLRDPSLKLPDPKQDRQESSHWATLAFGAHSSLITGFNKARNEVLFTESWGESFRNRRMRQEEMEATVHGIFIFEY